MNWNEFIREVARQKLSSEKLRLTFIDTFGDNESPKIDKTVEGHLREIYKRFESECSALTTAKKGKKEILRDYLQTLYANQRDFTGISDRPSTSTNPQSIPAPEPIPELTTLEFIGRDRDLTNLANLRNQYKIVLIKAGAGVGKSTLAREFLQTRFKKVIRIEMGLESGNVTTAEEKVSQILRKDFDEEPSRDFGINLDILREKLADRVNPIGVLIDNLEPALDENYRFREKLRGYDALLAVLGDRDVFSFTLITSRRSLIAQRVKVHEYSLEGLDITAWRQYFHDCENGTDSEALLHMCVAYNGNAKVMDILHGAIKNRFDGNIGAYWNRYKDALLADSELETLISVEMDWLRDHQPDAYKLLCRMGCYRYQDVKTVPFEGLICLLWDVPDSRKACVVNYLSKTSLVEIKGEYYLHPAIRENAKSQLLENRIDWEEANQKAAKFWQEQVKTIEIVDDALIAFESYHHYVEIHDYNQACQEIIRVRKNKWSDRESLGSSCYRLGLLQKVIYETNSLTQFVTPSRELCRMFHILSSLHQQSGSINDSIICAEKMKDFAHSLNLMGFIIDYSNKIALCKIDMWELDEAKNLFNHVLVLSETENPPWSKTTARITALFCLAFVYSCLEAKEKYLEIIKLSSQAYETIIKPDYNHIWRRANGLFYLGKVFMNLGDINRAFEIYCQAIEFTEASGYTQVKAKVLTSLAELYRLKQDFNIAISNHFKSIEFLSKIGAKCDLAEAYFQLGLTYQAMEEHDQAEEYKAKALELFAQMEASKQIERVNKAFGGNIQ